MMTHLDDDGVASCLVCELITHRTKLLLTAGSTSQHIRTQSRKTTHKTALLANPQGLSHCCSAWQARHRHCYARQCLSCVSECMMHAKSKVCDYGCPVLVPHLYPLMPITSVSASSTRATSSRPSATEFSRARRHVSNSYGICTYTGTHKPFYGCLPSSAAACCTDLRPPPSRRQQLTVTETCACAGT